MYAWLNAVAFYTIIEVSDSMILLLSNIRKIYTDRRLSSSAAALNRYRDRHMEERTEPPNYVPYMVSIIAYS